MRPIAKFAVIWALGITVLLGWSEVSVAQSLQRTTKLPIQSTCSCPCLFANAQNHYELGKVSFPSATAACNLVVVDRYFVCKDSTGQDRAGQFWAVPCTFTQGLKSTAPTSKLP
jgi:hypothetical protein